MVLHFVPDIPAWSSGELMSAVLSDAGMRICDYVYHGVCMPLCVCVYVCIVGVLAICSTACPYHLHIHTSPETGLQELRKQCGKTVGLTEADHIPHTTTYSGVARMRAGAFMVT